MHGINHKEKEHQKHVNMYNSFAKIRGLKKELFTPSYPKKSLSFEDSVNAAMKTIKKSTIFCAEPKHYDRYIKNRDEKNLPKEPKASKFKGEKLHSAYTLCTLPFTRMTWIETVYYADESQGRSPETTLVGAVLTQGASMGYCAAELTLGTDEDYHERLIQVLRTLK